MGWTAYYQILRDRPLDDRELAALDDYLRTSNQPPWESEGFGLAVTKATRTDRVLGEGWTKLPMDLDDSTDHQRLCDALGGLRAIIAGVELRISDDFSTFGFEGEQVVLGGRGGPALVELANADRATFADPGSLIPPRHAVLPAEVTTFIEGQDATSEQVQAALLELAQIAAEHPSYDTLCKRLSAAPHVALAQAGFAVYREINRSHAWNLVRTALENLDDVQPIVAGFLSIWCNPHGIYWYGDMSLPDRTRDALARVPDVEIQMRTDLAESVEGSSSELAHRRAERAAHMLGYARTPTSVLALVEAARTMRDRPMSSDQRHHTSPGIQQGLIIAGVPAVVPTLLLGFDAAHGLLGRQREALPVLAKLAPARVLPVLRHLAGLGDALYEVVMALEIARNVATLRELCEFPVAWHRERAFEALRKLGEQPPPLGELPAPESLVTHTCREVRESALAILERTKDPAIVTSVIAVHVLNAAIGRRFNGSVGSYGEFMELLPDDLRFAAHDVQLAALRGGQVTTLPAQIIWPAVQPILDGHADALAANYAPPELHFEPATATQLREEEAIVMDALRAGRLDPDTSSGEPVVLATRPPAELMPPPPPPPIQPKVRDAEIVKTEVAEPQVAEPDAVIDDLLTALAREKKPTDLSIERANLPRTFANMDSGDRANAIRKALLALGAQPVGRRLLARLTELHDGRNLRELADAMFPQIASVPEGARELAVAWEQAYTLPWESPGRADDYFQSVAAIPELFTRALDEIAAPDNGALSRRTSGAFELLAAANDRREDATAAVVARIRADRGRSSHLISWRSDAYRALRRAKADAIPTTVLELADPNTVGRSSSLLDILPHSERGLAFLAQAVDLPELSSDAVKEMLRARSAGDDARIRYLEHPFWKVRLVAADANSDWNQSRVETFAVWAAIDASRIPIPDRDREYARPRDAAKNATWDDLARSHGRPITLPPLPPVRDGLAAPCADYRAWAVWATDQRLDPDDAVARVFADELDIAMVGYGHLRNAPRWLTWQAKVPGLPADRRSRLAWARERRDAPLSLELARVRDEGAMAVAKALPRPHLVLPEAIRAELEALERPFVERGAALLGIEIAR
ncbi:MAG: hypothetical protein JWO36_5671 [Myxococcales bacterium]|nr:hypothetical protein [Myxococcales bacterium]